MKMLRLLLLAPLLAVPTFAADVSTPPASPAPVSPPAAGKAQPAVPAATLADAEAVLKAMHYDDTLNRMLDQQKRAVVSMTRQMVMRMNAPGTSPEEYEAFQQKAIDTAWAGIKADDIHADVARIYAELFTKDELHDIAAFYGTPAGQALVVKLPEVQQKIIAVLMPRMMQIVPKIQQMAKDFVAERQALAKKTLDEAAKNAPAGKPAAEPSPATPTVSAPAPAPSSPPKP
ncbi:MAG TPA: DUF2059 domain-containing protein [Opitutaceae bacterium]|nr:DUF2059 domain-containing protein [Opitutaceae bacterium]